MNYVYLLCLMVFAYLYGSIPFALVIGKVFYGVDVREHGSGNLGGTNTGRVLGYKAGLACIILDILKCCISVSIARLLIDYLPANSIYYVAISCVLGHCFPIFANFKGGKAVSVLFGYLLGTNFLMFAIVGLFFLGMLKITKYVSLSSMCASVLMVILTPFIIGNPVALVINIFLSAFLIYRHRANIKRLMDHTESKIKWM